MFWRSRKDADRLHPMPGQWGWWGSRDGGERYIIGPCASPEQVVTIADNAEWPEVTVCHAKQNNQDLAAWFDVVRILDVIQDDMDESGCGGDEDGNRHPLDEITPALMADLDQRLKRTIRQWQSKHKLPLRSPQFADIIIHETVLL